VTGPTPSHAVPSADDDRPHGQAGRDGDSAPERPLPPRGTPRRSVMYPDGEGD